MSVNEAQVRKALGLLMASVTPDDRDEESPRFGALIKDARASAGMSLQSVADAMHSSKAHLWEVEQERCNPLSLIHI